MSRFNSIRLIGVAVFLFATVLSALTVRAEDVVSTSVRPAPGSPAHPFRAQIVGLVWLNPLQRRDYPTEWQLLWTQGLTAPNKNDDMARTDPNSFSTLKSVASVAYGNRGKETFEGFYYKYVDELLALFRVRYATNPGYFYTVKPEDRKNWRELAGIHIELAVPWRLGAGDAQTILRDFIKKRFLIGNPSFPNLWTRDTPPDVQVTQGDANAGFTSLNKALDYLQANPDKSVWVMNWDAPSFPPKDAQINENLVVLFLAGPNFNTEREPLAWIGKSATSDTREFESKAGMSRAVQAWKAAIEKASHNANIAVSDIQYVVHDAGKDSDAASARLAALSQTLTEVLPEYDYGKQMFNTSALLGDMGTGSALTDVALAIGRINHFGGNALIAGTTDAQHPVAVVVTPPSKLTPIDPDKDWFRARGENNAYLPWWGRRHDARPASQGYSE
ncbi:virulence factor [Burkholderia sp. 4701]|nr:virulence factor [Burkholderia sp. 4701]MXN82345.1 virulence factor [Burkholderia sp. 4812]